MSEDFRRTVEGGVLTVTIDRPQRMNAFGIRAAWELARIIEVADRSPALISV